MEIKKTWYTNKKIKDIHEKLPIRQVYLWFLTLDNQIVIVGNGKKWQFPGGKPAAGETILEALKRECWEEAGIKLDQYHEDPTFFGYYLIENDVNSKWESGDPYLQVRYFIKVNVASADIQLSVNEREGDADTLDDVKFVNLYRLNDHIAWVNDDLEEYLEIKNIVSRLQTSKD